MEQKWYNYIIFDKIRTYIGSTVNLNRRIRQHNGIIKGGAKCNRGGVWDYYCVIYNIHGHKKLCLSEEWHLKWATNKIKRCRNTFERRKKALEKYISKKPDQFKYIVFVNKKYIQYLPKFNSSVFTYILANDDDFLMKNIETKILQFKNFTTINRHITKQITANDEVIHNIDIVGTECPNIVIYFHKGTKISNIETVMIYDDRFNIDIKTKKIQNKYYTIENVTHPIINIIHSRYELSNGDINITYEQI